MPGICEAGVATTAASSQSLEAEEDVRQAVMTAPGGIEFRDVPAPAPEAGEVLIATRRIGICGSDIHVNHGRHPYTSYPVVQGHEVSGLVAGLGDGVVGLRVGDMVTFTPQITCGKCLSCLEGSYNICESLKVMGFQAPGAAQDFFTAPEWNVIPVPRRIGLDHAAMIEPLAVAVHAIGRTTGVAGKQVLVLGAGTIGNLVAQACRALGAKCVVITDLQEYKLDKARACGIGQTVNTAVTPLGDAIAAEFGPSRADLIFECVGSRATVAQAIENARKGTTVVIVGVFSDKPEINMGFVQDRELHIVGSAMYKKEDYRVALKLVGSGKIELDQLVTHRFKFAEYGAAYATIDQSGGRYMKVLIDLD